MAGLPTVIRRSHARLLAWVSALAAVVLLASRLAPNLDPEIRDLHTLSGVLVGAAAFASLRWDGRLTEGLAALNAFVVGELAFETSELLFDFPGHLDRAMSAGAWIAGGVAMVILLTADVVYFASRRRRTMSNAPHAE